MPLIFAEEYMQLMDERSDAIGDLEHENEGQNIYVPQDYVDFFLTHLDVSKIYANDEDGVACRIAHQVGLYYRESEGWVRGWKTIPRSSDMVKTFFHLQKVIPAEMLTNLSRSVIEFFTSPDNLNVPALWDARCEYWGEKIDREFSAMGLYLEKFGYHRMSKQLTGWFVLEAKLRRGDKTSATYYINALPSPKGVSRVYQISRNDSFEQQSAPLALDIRVWQALAAAGMTPYLGQG